MKNSKEWENLEKEGLRNHWEEIFLSNQISRGEKSGLFNRWLG